MTSTTVMKPREQWTLLNLTHRRTRHNQPCTAALLLRFADAAVEDLDGLRDAGLVAGYWAVGPDAPFCPECLETVQHRPPTAWGMPEFLPVPRYSHRDGTPLCPVYGPDGVVPAEPTSREVEQFAGLGRAELSRIRVDPTPAGKRWCVTDPHNKVMLAASHDGRSWPLRLAVREHDLDLAAVAACVDAGLVRVYDVVTGWPCEPTPAALRAAMTSRPDTVWLEPDVCGARLVTP